jgi:hypothetical protein
MPVFLSYPSIGARTNNSTFNPFLDKPDQSNVNVTIIASTVASVAGLVVIALVVKHVGLPRFRRYKEQKAAKDKAIADREAWYRSTRPVMRRPTTPRVLSFYSRSPHIQGHQEVGSPTDVAPIEGPSPSYDAGNSSAGQSGIRYVALRHSTAPTVSMKPLPGSDPGHQQSMAAGSDLGMQTLDKHQTASTVDTVFSIGIAVPMNLPASVSPAEVHNGRRAQTEPESDYMFVVGDHDEK